MLARVFPRAAGFAISRMNAADVFDKAIAMAEKMGENPRDGLKKLNETIKFDLRDDLLASIGDEIIKSVDGYVLRQTAPADLVQAAKAALKRRAK